MLKINFVRKWAAFDCQEREVPKEHRKFHVLAFAKWLGLGPSFGTPKTMSDWPFHFEPWPKAGATEMGSVVQRWNTNKLGKHMVCAWRDA